MTPVTPEQVESRLLGLSEEVDSAHKELSDAEMNYHKAKIAFELNMAKMRLAIAQSNQKLRVNQVEDEALWRNEKEWEAIQIAEALVKAARSNANRVRTQVDIARSVGTSVRASMEL